MCPFQTGREDHHRVLDHPVLLNFPSGGTCFPTDVSATPLLNPSMSAIITEAHNDDTAHPRVATVDASTMTDSVQTNEASSPATRQPHPQTSHASTQTVPPPVVTTNETSLKTDRTPRLQPKHASTQMPQPPVVMERCTQTDTVPHPRTMQAAT